MENKETKKQKKENKFFKWVKAHNVELTVTGLTVILGTAIYAVGRIHGWTDGYDKGTADTIVDANNMIPGLIDTVARESYFATRDVIDANDHEGHMKEIVEAGGGEKNFGANVSMRFYESPFVDDFTTEMTTILKNRK